VKRHRARRLALQGLCCLDVQGEHAADLVDEFLRDSREPPPTLEAAAELLQAVRAAAGDCDALLARHARNWDLPRLALVDRNILRLACYELLAGRTPLKVVISEAIKLAHEFSAAESPRFINGVLDAVARELLEHRQAGGAAPGADPGPPAAGQEGGQAPVKGG
jgi:N utilization substance protein B